MYLKVIESVGFLTVPSLYHEYLLFIKFKENDVQIPNSFSKPIPFD